RVAAVLPGAAGRGPVLRPRNREANRRDETVVENEVPRRVRGNPDVWNEQWTTHQLTMDDHWILTAHPEDGRYTLLLTEIPVGAAKPRQFKPELPPGFRKELDVFTYTCAGDTLLGFGRYRGREAPGPVVLRWDLSNGKLV